jgi:glycosyltransferase involved in cell wall biosynthesis
VSSAVPLSVLHFALSDLEGGAAKAGYRTHTALREAGIDSRLIVRSKVSDDPHVQAVAPLPRWESRRRRLRAHLPLVRPAPLPEATETFNFDLRQDFDRRSLFALEPGRVDVVCLHRITRFLTVRQIRELYEHYRCPVVWVLLDQNPLTGGCHYSFDCEGYTRQCGRCPQLESDDPGDHSHTIWLRKRADLTDLPITFVAPSSDTLDWLRASSLFRDRPAQRIPVPIDAEVFRPLDRNVARTVLDLPAEATIVFVGAAYLPGRRKGARQAVEALTRLAALLDEGTRGRIFVLVAGDGAGALLAELPFPGKALARLHDELSLALAYQSADVYLSPSVADAGPMMVPEALLCGTPVVAFEVGYARDLVTSPDVGALAPTGDTDALADALLETLTRAPSSGSCRRAAEHFGAGRVAAAHVELYRSLSGSTGDASAG